MRRTAFPRTHKQRRVHEDLLAFLRCLNLTVGL